MDMEISLDATGRCRVIAGPERRVYYSTPSLIGLALLQQETARIGQQGAAVTAARNITWHDLLVSHGAAFGTAGDRRYTLAVVPPTTRTLSYSGADTSRVARVPVGTRLSITFPHLLVGLATGPDHFYKGVIYELSAARVPTLSTGVAAELAVPFKWGNVYTGRGTICWGTVRHGHIRDIPGFLDLFFSSDFNGDLYYGSRGSLAADAAHAAGVIAPATTFTHTMTQVIAELATAGA